MSGRSTPSEPADGQQSTHERAPASELGGPQLAVTAMGPLTRWVVDPLVTTVRLGSAPHELTGAVALLAIAAAAFLAATGIDPLRPAAGLSYLAGALLLRSSDVGARRHSGMQSAWSLTGRAIADGVFLLGLAVAAARAGGAKYTAAGVLAVFVALYYAIALWRSMARPAAPDTAAQRPAESAGDRPEVWSRIAEAVSKIVDRPTAALLVAILSFIAGAEPLFAMTATTGIAWMTIRATGLAAPGDRGTARNALFYGIGLAVLAFLVSRLPLADVFHALEGVGARALFVLLIGALLTATTATSLYILLNGEVRWRTTFYAQFVGDGYNQILPLGGLGGEPYKLKVLAPASSLESASHAIVLDRLLHTIPGPVGTAVLLPVALSGLTLSGALTTSLGITAGAMVLLSTALLLVTFSRVPGRVTDALIKRLAGLANAARSGVPRTRLAAALVAKLSGQVVLTFEVWLLFHILGIDPTVTDVATVTAWVTVSAVMFFVVPQQIGINEAGIAVAFEFLGLPIELGLAFALLRRARQVSWSLLGVSVHLTGVALVRRRSGHEVSS